MEMKIFLSNLSQFSNFFAQATAALFLFAAPVLYKFV